MVSLFHDAQYSPSSQKNNPRHEHHETNVAVQLARPDETGVEEKPYLNIRKWNSTNMLIHKVSFQPSQVFT